jgi:putative transposase
MATGPRDFDTQVGTIATRIPKLRTGSYFWDWLFEQRRRAKAALVTVAATSYLLGVSTPRMERLVEQLGITRLSKSQVSQMARDLDEQRGLPHPTVGRRPLHVPGRRRPDAQGPRGRPGGQGARPGSPPA